VLEASYAMLQLIRGVMFQFRQSLYRSMNEGIIDRSNGSIYGEEDEKKMEKECENLIEKRNIKVVSGISISKPLVCVVEVCLALRCGVDWTCFRGRKLWKLSGSTEKRRSGPISLIGVIISA
jgi:hypothetical protein